jgi:hypothetical protein
MTGEGLSREVAGTLHIDVSASAQCDGLTAASVAANDQTLDQATRRGAYPGARMRETQATEIPLRQTAARGNAADPALTPPTEGSR